MPVASYTEYLDNMGTATMQLMRKRLADAIFKANPTSAWLLSKGKVKFESGGKFITTPLMYGKNKTIRAYKGYDVLNVDPTEEITAARYQWRQAAGSVVISGLEELENAGEAQLFDILKTKLRVLEMSFKEWLNEKLHAATATKDISRDILGFPELIENTAEASQGTLGGISKTTYDWWRNRRSAVASATYAYTARPLTKALINFTNNCSKGLTRPDLFITDQTTFEDYEKENMDNIRYQMKDQDTLDIGFPSLKFKGVTIMWDEHSTADLVYALNTEFLEFVIHKQRNFVMTPFVKPHNQDARTAQMLFAGNLTCSNCRFQGVLDTSGITYS